MIQEQSLQKKARNIIFSSSKFAKGLFAGFYRSVFRGPGMELEEVRAYQPGDDVKSIDWRVSARFGELHTKLFREERGLPVFIVFDVSRSMDYGSAETSKRETAALAAAALSYAAVYNSDMLGAVLFSNGVEKWIKPGNGTTQAARCVKDFLEYQALSGGSNINAVLEIVHRAAIRRGICFLISDFKMEIDPLLLWRLKKRQELVAVRILDRNEYAPPVQGLIPLRDLETDGTEYLLGKRITRAAPGSNDPYSEQRSRFRRNGVGTVEIFTDQDPFQILYNYFRKKAKG